MVEETKESTEVTETTRGQEQTEEQVEAQPEVKEEKKEEKKEAPKRLGSGKKGRSFQEILKETKAEAEGKEVKPEVTPEEKKAEEAKADTHKKPSNERIQELVNKNKEFQVQLSDEQKSNKELTEQLKSIEDRLEKKEVEKAKKVTEKEEKIDFAEIKESLEDQGWTEKQVNTYIKNLQQNQELRGEIKKLQEWVDSKNKDDAEERKDKDEKDRKDFTKKQEGIYLELAKLPEYKDYFNVPENGEMPTLKDPEMDKAALELSSLFNVPVYLEDGKETVNVNPVLMSKEGLQMLIFWVTRKGRANIKAKEKVEKEQSLKNKVVTQPSVNKSLRIKGKRSFGEILEETRKEMNM